MTSPVSLLAFSSCLDRSEAKIIHPLKINDSLFTLSHTQADMQCVKKKKKCDQSSLKLMQIFHFILVSAINLHLRYNPAITSNQVINPQIPPGCVFFFCSQPFSITTICPFPSPVHPPLNLTLPGKVNKLLWSSAAH